MKMAGSIFITNMSKSLLLYYIETTKMCPLSIDNKIDDEKYHVRLTIYKLIPKKLYKYTTLNLCKLNVDRVLK